MSFGNEIARKVGQQIINGIVVLTIGALVIGFIVGMYFLDHYRWGGCK